MMSNVVTYLSRIRLVYVDDELSVSGRFGQEKEPCVIPFKGMSCQYNVVHRRPGSQRPGKKDQHKTHKLSIKH